MHCDFLIMFWWLKGQFSIVCIICSLISSKNIPDSVASSWPFCQNISVYSTTINFIHVLQIAVGETRWPHQATSQTNEESCNSIWIVVRCLRGAGTSKPLI